MTDLLNLVVDLDERFALSPAEVGALERSVPGVSIAGSAVAGDTVLAWIDSEFGGSWSSQAHAGTNALAVRDGAPIGFATFDARGFRFRWLRGIARDATSGSSVPLASCRPSENPG